MRIEQSQDVRAANFPAALVLFDLKTYRFFFLNNTAALIWHFCRKPRSLNQIFDFIGKRYQLSLLKAKKDAMKIIGHLKTRELIVCR